MGLETFVAWHGVRRRWADRVKVLEQNVFPGYVFCHSTFSERLTVMHQAGVERVVSFDRTPALIPDAEIASLRRAVQSELAAGTVAVPQSRPARAHREGRSGGDGRNSGPRISGMARGGERLRAAEIHRRGNRPGHDRARKFDVSLNHVAVTKPRNKSPDFPPDAGRIPGAASASSGARSLSDFARTKLLGSLGEPALDQQLLELQVDGGAHRRTSGEGLHEKFHPVRDLRWRRWRRSGRR